MNIAVYCGSNPNCEPRFIQAAEAVGRWIGSRGDTLVYGGSSIGLMGAVSRETLAAGGSAIGVEPSFFIEAGVAQHDLTQLIVVETMGERKEKMIELADVFVALPGGVGTLEEISEVMSRIRLRMEAGPCYFLNMDGFYEGLRQLVGHMEQAGFIDARDVECYVFCDTVEDLCTKLDAHQVLEDAKSLAPIVPESNIFG